MRLLILKVLESNKRGIIDAVKVLLQSKIGRDRKGEKFTCKRLGPYTVANITKIGLYTLMNEKGGTLHKKYNVSLLKLTLKLIFQTKLIKKKQTKNQQLASINALSRGETKQKR